MRNMQRFECMIEVRINDTVLTLCSYGQEELKLPDTDLYLYDNTSFNAVIGAASLKTYDYALPQPWLEEHYWSKGKDTPRGVWSYDTNSVFGEFVGLGDMLRSIGGELQKLNITSVYGLA